MDSLIFCGLVTLHIAVPLLVLSVAGYFLVYLAGIRPTWRDLAFLVGAGMPLSFAGLVGVVWLAYEKHGRETLLKPLLSGGPLLAVGTALAIAYFVGGFAFFGWRRAQHGARERARRSSALKRAA